MILASIFPSSLSIVFSFVKRVISFVKERSLDAFPFDDRNVQSSAKCFYSVSRQLRSHLNANRVVLVVDCLF